MKKLITIVICIILVAAALVAQTAKVIHLKTEDQVQAKKLYNDLQAAQKAWDEFNTKIADKYAAETLHSDGTLIKTCVAVNSKTGKGVNCQPATRPKEGWHNGFEFSEDFTAIVPKSTSSYTLSTNGWGSMTNVPGTIVR